MSGKAETSGRKRCDSYKNMEDMLLKMKRKREEGEIEGDGREKFFRRSKITPRSPVKGTRVVEMLRN